MINTYHYSAHFAGRICEDCFEHFSNVNVSLYRSTEDECPDQVSIKNAFRQLSDGELKKMKSSLLAEGVTDESGKVDITIDPGKPGYQGECIEVVITFNRIVGNNQELKQPEHFRIAYYTPQWNPTENYYAHFSDFYVPASIWCAYLEQHGVWVICGHVNTCDKPATPIDNVTVKAYDVDWVQDDFLGSATTDSSGEFKIYYDVSKFNRTPYSPFINIEWTGGPDVYFKIEGVDSGGGLVTLLDEPPSRGRQPDRENVPNCFCTRLCVSIERPPRDIADSAWTGIGTQFTLPDSSSLNDFDAQGYAGSLKYAFTRNIRTTGQSLRFSNGNPIEYRFLVSHTVANNGTPSLPAGNFSDIVGVGATSDLFVATIIGQMWRFSPSFKIVKIIAIAADLDSEGWLDVNKSIVRKFTDDPLLDPLELSIPGMWQWVDLDGMIKINTTKYINYTEIKDSIIPIPDAGEPIPDANQVPIQKMAIRFETREVIDKATNNFVVLPGNGMTLNSMVVNNNLAFMTLAIKEHLATSACEPLSGDVYAVYTVSHPHLEDVNITVQKDSDTTSTSLPAAPPVPLINNIDTTLDLINNSTGIRVNDSLAMTSRCTYIVTLHVKRRLHTGDGTVGESPDVHAPFFWEG